MPPVFNIISCPDYSAAGAICQAAKRALDIGGAVLYYINGGLCMYITYKGAAYMKNGLSPRVARGSGACLHICGGSVVDIIPLEAAE